MYVQLIAVVLCVESLSNGSHPKAIRSGAGNARPHRRGASLPSLDGVDGKPKCNDLFIV